MEKKVLFCFEHSLNEITPKFKRNMGKTHGDDDVVADDDADDDDDNEEDNSKKTTAK